jgi:hypothetical protein
MHAFFNTLLGKRIEQLDASGRKILHIASYRSQSVNHRDGGNLLVNRIAGIDGF